MAYIGNQPAESFTSFATQEFSTSATTSYTLNHAVTNENEIALFVNNVRQQPGSGKAYTATGTALTLSAATASTDTMYCVFLGRALQTVTPATNSITAAMVGNDLISGKDALTSEPATTDEFLVSDAGTLKRIDYSLIKAANTPAFFVELNASQTSISDDSFTKVTFNNESFDTNNAFDPSTNYRFTTPSDGAGKYVFFAQVDVDSEGNSNLDNSTLQFKKNNSVIRSQEYNHLSNPPRNHVVFSTILESMSANDYMEIFVRIEATDASGGVFNGTNSFFGGYKIIE